MALIRSFAGIRYNTDRVGTDISRQVAPPYDVLDQARKDALLAASRQNIAAVDLPHVPPAQAGPDQVYRQAGELLQMKLKGISYFTNSGWPMVCLFMISSRRCIATIRFLSTKEGATRARSSSPR